MWYYTLAGLNGTFQIIRKALTRNWQSVDLGRMRARVIFLKAHLSKY